MEHLVYLPISSGSEIPIKRDIPFNLRKRTDNEAHFLQTWNQA